MTLSDLWPQFQGHDILDIEYLWKLTETTLDKAIVTIERQ